MFRALKYTARRLLLAVVVAGGCGSWSGPVPEWGFHAHGTIAQAAIFALPPELLSFYKPHYDYLGRQALAPDKRRFVLEQEAPRHYCDLDAYLAYSDSLPWYYSEAQAYYPPDTLAEHGILPWHLPNALRDLEEAFRQKDLGRILRLSADLSHYLGDAHVPLHTTSNYNGQFTNQIGIHGLWERRLPELFSAQYPLLVAPARYIEHPQAFAWATVKHSHSLVPKVLAAEAELTRQFAPDEKYAILERNGLPYRDYSPAFSAAYHRALGGMVERQLANAIEATASFWYTAWLNAGQPGLSSLSGPAPEADERFPYRLNIEDREAMLRTNPDRLDSLYANMPTYRAADFRRIRRCR